MTTPAQPDPPTPLDDENVRVIPQTDGNVRIWLPAVEKLDTIGGYSAEIVIDDEATRQLLAALDTWLLKQPWPAEGCNTSDEGGIVQDSTTEAALAVARAILGGAQ